MHDATAPPLCLTDAAAEAEPDTDAEDVGDQPLHPDAALPDRPLNDTVAVATSPTRVWSGHVGIWAQCAATAVWAETAAASHQRGDNMQLRAAKEAQRLADQEARTKRKQ